MSVKASSGASISIIDQSHPATKNVGVGMYPSLMGTFSCHASVLMIGSIIGKTPTSYGGSLDSSFTEYFK